MLKRQASWPVEDALWTVEDAALWAVLGDLHDDSATTATEGAAGRNLDTPCGPTSTDDAEMALVFTDMSDQQARNRGADCAVAPATGRARAERTRAERTRTEYQYQNF